MYKRKTKLDEQYKEIVPSEFVKDSFVFYISFFEAIENALNKQLLTDKEGLCLYNSICKLALYGEEPSQTTLEEMGGIGSIIFGQMIPQIKANTIKAFNGKKGGAPKKEKTSGYLNEKPNEKEKEKENENENENENDFFSNKEENINYEAFKTLFQLYPNKEDTDMSEAFKEYTSLLKKRSPIEIELLFKERLETVEFNEYPPLEVFIQHEIH